MQRSHTALRRDLLVFLGIIGTLITIGLLFTYSASSVYALETFGSARYFVHKQLWGLGIGLAALIACFLVPTDLIAQASPFLFAGSLGLTALTLMPSLGLRVHGSARWLNLLGFSFQPSELLKVALLLYTAHLLAAKEHRLQSFWHGYAPFVVLLALTALVLLQQPDFGLTVTLAATVLALLFIAQIKTKHLLLTLATLIPLGLGLIWWYPYRLKRVLTFLNPWHDPHGAGFQVIQSLIAIGSGGLWGAGIAHSKQKFFYLPMQHTDFIFAIIAEETGFVGASLVVLLYLLFLYYGLKLAWRLTDRFSCFATLGFVLMISLQALINLMVNLGLAPTKGIGLPFISYGNSALVCSLAMIGLIAGFVWENSSR